MKRILQVEEGRADAPELDLEGRDHDAYAHLGAFYPNGGVGESSMINYWTLYP